MGIESMRNFARLAVNSNQLSQQPLLKEDEVIVAQEPAVLSVNRSVKPEEVLTIMASSATLNGVAINTDTQNQARLDNARINLENALKALAENEDPIKLAKLQKAVENAQEAYNKVLEELAEAGFLETQEAEVAPLTKGLYKEGVERKEIIENGRVVGAVTTKYDENGEVILVIKSTYTYDEAGNCTETAAYYDPKGIKLGTRIIENYSNGNSRVYETCDEDGKRLIGNDGQVLDYRDSSFDARGNYRSHMVVRDVANNISLNFPGVSYEENVNGTSYFYDSNDQLLGYITQDGNIIKSTKYTYDAQGRVITEEKEAVDINNKEWLAHADVKHEYNADGSEKRTTTEINKRTGEKLVTKEYLDENGKIYGRVREQYDAKGALVSRDVDVEKGYTIPEEAKKPMTKNDLANYGDNNPIEFTVKNKKGNYQTDAARNGAKTAVASFVDSLCGSLMGNPNFDSVALRYAKQMTREYFEQVINMMSPHSGVKTGEWNAKTGDIRLSDGTTMSGVNYNQESRLAGQNAKKTQFDGDNIQWMRGTLAGQRFERISIKPDYIKEIFMQFYNSALNG